MDSVFFDIDTQLDFLYPAGALYVPGAEHIVANIKALNQHAGARGIPLISSLDAHAENDVEFQKWPPHCVVGTTGQLKPAALLLEQRRVVPNVVTEFALTGQILLEKQTFDCFTNINLAALLQQANARRYVVYGVVTEICVRLALEGLVKTGQRVELVSDAVCSLDSEKAKRMTAWFTAQGGVLTTVAEVLG